ncbi:AsmA family protein [Chitinimonas naiadis]
MKKLALYAASALVVLTLLGMLGVHFAAKALKDQVVAALGTDSEVGDISLGLSAVVVRDLSIRAPNGWPAKETLHASQIRIEPDLRALVSSELRIRRIEVEGAYLSVLRPARGPMRLLPSLLERPTQAAADPSTDKPGTKLDIGEVVLKDAVLEFYDASIAKPAHKLRLEQVEASVRDLALPNLTSRTEISLHGVVKGVHGDGTLAINGWSELASKESELHTRLQQVDLLALKPYLIKAADTGIRNGKLDLAIDSTVHDKRLHAPGQLKLVDLELEARGGVMGSIMGLPRSAVVSALKDRQGVIDLRFTLDGNLNDPKFSLNEQLAMRIGAGLASSLGVSVEGLARGVGNTAGSLTEGVKKLFGK